MIVIVSVFFQGSLVTVWKLDLGHSAMDHSLHPFSFFAVPSAVCSAIEIVLMFSSLQLQTLFSYSKAYSQD